MLVNPYDEEYYKCRETPVDDSLLGPYYKDQTTILHSLPFRRMKHKAQVFFAPNNDHVCTRIEHSLHVATVAETIARLLGFNGELAYAIGLGHDLGHAPFGHAGEVVLNRKTSEIGGFTHEVHGLRVVDVLGNRGVGLNLSFGVRDGIVCHCGEADSDNHITPRSDGMKPESITKRGVIPCSYEGCIARISDRIAYLGRDLEDSIYGGFVNESDVPEKLRESLGTKNGEIIEKLVRDLIETSKRGGQIAFSDEFHSIMFEMHKFSKERIYAHPAIERYKSYCERIIDTLFDYLAATMTINGWDLEKYFKSPVPLDRRFGYFLRGMRSVYINGDTIASNMVIVRDYIAGMTDGYALRSMREISLPNELAFEP